MAEITDIITTWEKMDTSMEVIIIITIIVIIAVAIVRMLEGVVMVIEVEVKGETITLLDETTTLITETEIEVGHARHPGTCQKLNEVIDVVITLQFKLRAKGFFKSISLRARIKETRFSSSVR